MGSCIFCKITEGTAPAAILYQDSQVLAFHDIHPRAPVHILIAPRKHIESLNQVGPQDGELLGHMLLIAQQLANQAGISQSGYRLVINTGTDGGQSVPHLHLHILGGERIGYPIKQL
ncbi:MAG: histidine triad nucleotide-binding protein [Anaerolineaceae bacterium]|nr:histidine triad nucleotide-binding protein [Anaerolineaceae bacterium]